MEFNYDLLFSFFGIPFLYMLIIYFTSPYKTISLKEGAKAIMLGFVSITILHFMYIIVILLQKLILILFQIENLIQILE